MPSLRTPESKRKYKEYQKALPVNDSCLLCEKEALVMFTYWKIVENSFPYDLIADTHHMLMPLRHVVEKDLTFAEVEELKKIKMEVVDEKYDYIIESTHNTKSLPSHFHLHIIVGKS